MIHYDEKYSLYLSQAKPTACLGKKKKKFKEHLPKSL